VTRDTADVLRNKGINPSAQRVAIAEYVLSTSAHPTADEVCAEVRRRFPMVSRATVYNTLNLFAEKGLLRRHVLTEGSTVFDPNVKPHHHFIDEGSGKIFDIPWDLVNVENVAELDGFEVKEYQVVMRGRRKRPKVSKPEGS
jgi:Fur family iron response transcriptional regulator